MAISLLNPGCICYDCAGADCCSIITGFDITVSGVTYSSCSNCSSLNNTFRVPLSSGGSTCAGTYNIGNLCGLFNPTYFADWSLVSATRALTVRIIDGSSNVYLSRAVTLSAATPCCSLSASGVDSYNNNGYDCDFSAATFSSIAAYC